MYQSYEKQIVLSIMRKSFERSMRNRNARDDGFGSALENELFFDDSFDDVFGRRSLFISIAIFVSSDFLQHRKRFRERRFLSVQYVNSYYQKGNPFNRKVQITHEFAVSNVAGRVRQVALQLDYRPFPQSTVLPEPGKKKQKNETTSRGLSTSFDDKKHNLLIGTIMLSTLLQLPKQKNSR